MRLGRAIKISAVAGFAIPVIVTAASAVMDFYQLYPQSFEVYFYFSAVAQLFWPTSIMLMAAPPNWSITALTMVLLAALANVLVYICLGTLIWLIAKGLHAIARARR